MKKFYLFLLVALLILNGAITQAREKLSQPPGLVFNDGDGMKAIGAPYRISQPNSIALEALKSDDKVQIQVGDWVVFTPSQKQKNTGFILYHGAETDPRGYARPLRAISEQGYFVVAVTMPKYMAVMAPYKAKEVIEKYNHIQRWVVAGHSLGGTMVARFAQKYEEMVSGVLFWDSYPLPNAKLHNKDFVVGQIYRTDLDGNKPDNFQKVEHLLPDEALLYPIAGAEHTYFGDFDLAAHRPEPLRHLTVDKQQELIIESTLSFLATISAQD